MVRSGLMNIVAHPDFIKVRCWESFHAWLAMPGSLDLIRETLTAMRETGVALEVSSAGLRKDFAEPYPAPPHYAPGRRTGRGHQLRLGRPCPRRTWPSASTDWRRTPVLSAMRKA